MKVVGIFTDPKIEPACKVRRVKLTRRLNDRVERDFDEFTKITKGSTNLYIYESNNGSYSGIGGNRNVEFCSGKHCYAWNPEENWWYREIEIKPPPPKYHTFMVYGEFSYGKRRLNFFLVRIPYKGLNWYKLVIPELRRIANILNGKKNTYWNVEVYKEIDKTWEKSKLPLKRFYWRGNKLVEKRKA